MKKFFLTIPSLAAVLMLLTVLMVSTGCPEPQSPCDPPTNVVLTGISPNSATIKWSAPPNTTVEISISPQSDPAGPFTTTDSTFTIEGLTPNTDYDVTLRTLCPDGDTSEPTVISFKTQPIIIVDIIVQFQGQVDMLNLMCGGNNDITGKPTAIGWDTNYATELLHIEQGTTQVFILKETSSNGVKRYRVSADGITICNKTSKNCPTSMVTTSSSALLRGGNYEIEITPASATMYDSNRNLTGTYNMYR